MAGYDKKLDEYARNRKIFIDTCSLLHPGINGFWEAMIPYLKKYGNRVIIASAIYRELEKHAANRTDRELAHNARRSLQAIAGYWKAGLVEIRGEKDESFADNVFLYVFTKFRLKYNLLLITQDRTLAHDIEALNSLGSARTNRNIVVKRIGYGSVLEKICQ